MQYSPLGRTGLTVSRLTLGTMMLGSAGNPDHDEGVRMIHEAIDAGITLIDTADMYSAGESEVIVGAALVGRRDQVLVATKGHFAVGDELTTSGNSRHHLTNAVDASLRRLGVDHIDLYQVHRPDWSTDLDETLAALTDLVRAGKIREFGCSTYPAFELVEAQRVAEQRGHMCFRTEQPPYNLLARGVERDVLPVAQRLGMGVLTWSPLAFGFLTGKHRWDAAVTTEGRAAIRPAWFDPADPVTARKLDVVEQLIALAESLDLTLPALATAFPLHHPAVTSVILGPRTLPQLMASLETADLRLDAATLDRIDEIVPPGTDVYDAANWASLPWIAETSRRRGA